ncbi:GGDEF domain-containing protein [Amorphus suaedae]
MINAATDTSISLARMAIQEAHRRGFSVDADTFRVWFAYVTQEDPVVTGYIDRMDGRGQDITRDDIDRLLMLLPAEPPAAARMAAEPAPEPGRSAVAPAMAAATRGAVSDALHGLPRAPENLSDARRTAPDAAPPVSPIRLSRPAAPHSPADGRFAQPRPRPVETAPEAPSVRATPFDKLSELPNRHAFSKDVRRRWLHPDAKKGPQTIFLSSCRRPGEAKAENDLLISPMQAVMLVALTRVFEKLGPVYRYDAQTIGLILSGVTLRQTVSIAEAVRRSLEAKKDLAEMHGNAKVIFASAAVSLMADEDPAKAIALADRCLTVAARSGESRVVCETDPEMLPPADPARANRPIEDQYARIRTLLNVR